MNETSEMQMEDANIKSGTSYSLSVSMCFSAHGTNYIEVIPMPFSIFFGKLT